MTDTRFRFLFVMLMLFLALNTTTRTLLLWLSYEQLQLEGLSLVKIYIAGFFNDLITATYYFIPLVLYISVIPDRWFNHRRHRVILGVIAFTMLYAMLFSAVSEYFFWEEFGKRFNFIAVDYLVYTHEVIKNIQESYPLTLILLSLTLITALVLYRLKATLLGGETHTSLKGRMKVAFVLLALPLLAFNLFDKTPSGTISKNIYQNELAKNGTYALFSAFRHNTLDYDTFYKTLPLSQVMENLDRLEHFNQTHPKSFRSQHPLRKYNVILIMEESMSAAYMGIYGNKKQLTPHLDDLANKGLFFSNLFATGTRTVRGMEAVTLSVPPTPGRSIVKRPINNNLDHIGDIFQAQGYQNTFIYAGYGYFDNMNSFFKNNGFDIIDRTDFAKEEITFANVWGVCDEDLFNKTLKEADRAYAKKKPFFTYVMTTSNHRPYTYPEGKIDIPSHSGRSGGVKYADFAIGKFIEDAKKKAWFKDTIFVIIADHNGGSAGKRSLPLHRYRIPLILYAPHIITPKRITTLASQIDTMPTLFDLLGFEYQAHFYGNSILSPAFRPRAFIGNYQKLGYFDGESLTFLTPDKRSHKEKVAKLGLRDVSYVNAPISQEEEERVITYYQSASFFYKHSLPH